MKALFLFLAVTTGSLSYGKNHENQERALIAYMQVKPGTEKEFLAEADDVIEQSRAESGNITYQLHQSVTNPQLFVFYELFETDADLQYHRNAPHTKGFLQRTKPITVDFRLEEYAPTGELK